MWIGQYEPLELFLFVDQSSPNFLPNVEGVVDNVNIPEIFSIKVKNYQKLHRNLDVFWHSKIFWGGPSKSCTHVITPASRHVDWRSFVRILPQSHQPRSY